MRRVVADWRESLHRGKSLLLGRGRFVVSARVDAWPNRFKRFGARKSTFESRRLHRAQ